MRLSLYEMDREYDLKQAKLQGQYEERIQFVAGLIRQGQSKEQILSFLTTIMNIPQDQAEEYYRQATTN